MLQQLHLACEKVQDILDSDVDSEDVSYATSNGSVVYLEAEAALILELEVKALFDIAEVIFTAESLPQRELKSLLYVAYLLRRFDPGRERVSVELQLCQTIDHDHESGSYELFLFTCWKFDQACLNLSFDGRGFPHFDHIWRVNIPFYPLNIFQDIECLETAFESPQAIVQEILNVLEQLLIVGVGELRL